MTLRVRSEGDDTPSGSHATIPTFHSHAADFVWKIHEFHQSHIDIGAQESMHVGNFRQRLETPIHDTIP